ncbi:hypothetical protein [Paenibacillus sp. CAA11]|uniref:hypothetical protein n=1 Tax=Paenibacillus sp. CAA11 TaxID=1532905 RepID=UPI00131F249F|nr:hypothetical protein [Paenibacillus sp. CAA11]
MSLNVHSMMAYNHQYFRPQSTAPVRKEERVEKAASFADILNEKMKAAADSRQK